MKTIKIKSLSLLNFKGIRKLVIDDFGKETSIFGANGTGKTTIQDAFMWLLFGKDSSDRTTFEIKTLDQDNNVIPKIDHEVEAIIEIDGEEINIRRTFREKWVKKRGALEAEFVGNESVFHWNDVPVLSNEFSAKVSQIIDEKIFKLITSPTAFNALAWQDQRQVLINICGDVTDEEVAKGNPDYEKLLTKLTNKTLPEYQKQIKATIKKSKDELKVIPTRIDEVERGKPEAGDFGALEKSLSEKKSELNSIENQISDKASAQQEILNERSRIQKEIYSIESKLEDKKHSIRQKAKQDINNKNAVKNQLENQITEVKSEKDKAERKLTQLNNVLKNEEDDIKHLTAANNNIRAAWNTKNAQEFTMDEESCKCPTCKREFEAEDIENKKKELFANFQNNKMKELEDLSNKGKRNKELIDAANKEVEELKGKIEKGEEFLDNCNQKLEDLNASLEAEKTKVEVKTEEELVVEMLENDSDAFGYREEISELKDQLENVKGVDLGDLKEKKDAIQKEISTIENQLKDKAVIAQAENRIKELEKEESGLAQQIADYEKEQFIIDNFIKDRIDRLEAMINKRFEFVKFKLFETQVNGGEVPTCKALINGVPFSDANTASKINAGIDIINTLCDHYQVSAPIFIDNRESVIQLIYSDSQIVNLFVSKADKKLRVEANQLMETA